MREKRLPLSSNASVQVSFNRPSSEFRSRFIELKVIRGLVESVLSDLERVKLDTPVFIIIPHHTCVFSSSTRAEQHPSDSNRRSLGCKRLHNCSGPGLQPIQIQYLLLEGNATMGILVQRPSVFVSFFLSVASSRHLACGGSIERPTFVGLLGWTA